MIRALDNSTNNPNDVLVKLLLKVFDMFMVKFYYKKTGTDPYLLGTAINFFNLKSEVYFKMEKIKCKDHILVFIKSIVSQHVGLS